MKRVFFSAIVAAAGVFLGGTSQATLIWDGNASQGTSVFKIMNVDAGASCTVVTDPTEGLVFNFDKPSGVLRCEAHGAQGFNPAVGQLYYIGWKSKLSSTVTCNAIFQWKAYGTPMCQNFPIVLKTQNGNLWLTQDEPTCPCVDGASHTQRTLLLTPITTNTWYSHVLAIYVSDQCNTGYIEYWLNGVPQIFSNGSTRWYGRTFDGSSVDPKWGIYGATSTYFVDYVGSLKIGTTYDDVAPPLPNQPPATPTSLTAAPGNTQITLNWTASAGATSYNVKRAAVSRGPYTTIASPTSTTYPDMGLVNGTPYFYVVSAVNAFGESADSTEASATPGNVPAKFSIPPSAVTASAYTGSYYPSNTVDGSLSTRWAGNGDGTWIQYNLGGSKTVSHVRMAFYLGTTRLYYFDVQAGPSTSGPWTTVLANVTSGATTDYQTFDFADTIAGAVRIVGHTGSYDTYNNYTEVEVWGIEGGCSVPASPADLAATGGNRQVALSWTASTGASSYNVKRATVSGGPYTPVATAVTATSYLDTGLGDGTTYYYVVSAVNACGESADSAYRGATTIPAAPTGLTATPGNNQVALSWTASTGAASYNVKRATVSGGPYTPIATGVTGTSYTDTTAVNGTTYYYVVSAVNASGESTDSAQVSATPQAPAPPAAPTGLTATPAKRKITLAWNASAGAASYKVKRATVNGGPYTAIASGVTTTSYVNSGLTSGTTYYYVVSAVNAAGESPNSNQASATAK